MVWGLIFMVVSIIALAIIINESSIKQDKKILDDFIKHNSISDNNGFIKLIEKDGEQFKGDNPYQQGIEKFYWLQDKKINLCNPPSIMKTKDIINLISIPLENIAFYGLEGDYRMQQIIEGGGSSFTGAVLGGVIAGGVGAVIGSRKKIETKEKEIDNRKTYLYYIEENKTKELVFNKASYEKLKILVPNKDIEVIEKEKKLDNIKNEYNQELKLTDVYEDIEKLAKLRESGILTEEEFNKKKSELLNRI